MSDVSSFIDQFEKQGAALSRPVLPESNYRGNIVEITFRSNKVIPTKGANAGKETVLANWGVKIALDSQSAQTIMKQDNDVIVYGDSDTENCRGTLSLCEMGIDFQNNTSFWAFIGGIFEQVGLATKHQEDSGASSYSLERTILEGIYNGTEQVKANYMASSDFDEMLLPSKLAEHQMKNVSELVVAEINTKKCYVHIARRNNYRDKSVKEHYVRRIMLPAAFEAREDNLASVAE